MPMYSCTHCHKAFEASPKEGERLYCPHCDTAMSLPICDMELPPGTVLGGFQVVKLLGKGGMGNVYLAIQLSMQRPVALKVLPRAITQNTIDVMKFLAEVKKSGRIQHHNIVSAIDAGDDDGVYYLAMQYVDGETLEAKIDRDGVIPAKEALEYCLLIADALRYVWEKHGIFHKDIKPGNIMVTNSGDAFLLDMGIAQRIGDVDDLGGHIEGSPCYMSPEQSRGEQLSWSTDLYSLGTSLYHMVVGVPPFDNPDIMQIIEMHTSKPFPEPALRKPGAKLHPKLVELLRKMLAKKPKDRFKSWDDFEKVVQRLMKALDEPAGLKAGASASDTPKRSFTTSTRRHPKAKSKISSIFMLFNIAAMLLVGLGAGYYFIADSNNKKAIAAFNEAEEYIKKPDYSQQEALSLYAYASSLSDKFGVDEKLKDNISRRISSLEKKVTSTEEKRGNFAKLFPEASEKFNQARNLFVLGNDLMKEKNDDGGNFEKAKVILDDFWKILEQAAASEVPADREKIIQLGQYADSITKKVDFQIERKKRIASSPYSNMTRQERFKQRTTDYLADVALRKDHLRLRIFKLAKTRNYAEAKEEIKKDPPETEAVSKMEPSIKKAGEDFDKWKADLATYITSAEELWKGILDSGTAYAGETVQVDDEKAVVSGIEEDKITLKMADGTTESFGLDMIPSKDMMSVFTKAVGKYGDDSLYALLMLEGSFPEAAKLKVSSEPLKKEMSEFLRVYIKARLIRALKDQKAGSSVELDAVKDAYGSTAEFAAAEKELSSDASTSSAKK